MSKLTPIATLAPPIPVSVFTGFLGAGKTSVILGLLSRLPANYRVVLLKNEFGDIEVDSKLAQESSLTAVSEILNGCMCCVLVGQMKTAILEIREKYRPDRIIIESSGSAFPATLAFQLRELERETSNDIKLDAIITVIDAENFAGYEDTSVTARMQAQYSDALLINKWEHITERALDIVMDHLYTLNEHTPKIRCVGRTGVDPALIFGLDSKLFQEQTAHNNISPDHGHSTHVVDSNHHDEIETASIFVNQVLTSDMLDGALSTLPKEHIYRVKGFVRIQEQTITLPHDFILNWAFGRFDLTPYSLGEQVGESIRLTMMGERGEVKKWAERLKRVLVNRLE